MERILVWRTLRVVIVPLVLAIPVQPLSRRAGAEIPDDSRVETLSAPAPEPAAADSEMARLRGALRQHDAAGGSRREADSVAVELARLYNGSARYDSTIALLAPRATDPADSPNVWDPQVNWYLGVAYEVAGRLDEAVGAFIHHAAAYGDTATPPRLRDVYRRRHRTLEGLDRRLADAREVSRRRRVFDLPRVDTPAPEWALPALDGRRVRRSSRFEGRMVALEFWDTECAACLEALPRFAALAKDPRFARVTFLTVHREPPGGEPGARERARALMRERGWSFPVLCDTAGATAAAFGVVSLPTAVVIDRNGRVRYRTTGDTPDAAILRDQLADLVEEAAAPQSLR